MWASGQVSTRRRRAPGAVGKQHQGHDKEFERVEWSGMYAKVLLVRVSCASTNCIAKVECKGLASAGLGKQQHGKGLIHMGELGQ